MVFNKYIKEKIDSYEYQLLLVNIFFIYINLNFLDYANRNQIIISVLFLYIIY